MHSNAPVTVTSIPELMLSMPTEKHGVFTYSRRVMDELVTLPEAMRAAGFATFSMVTNVNAGPRQGLDAGFDSLLDRISYVWEEDVDRTVPIEAVMQWVERHRERPMFLYIHTAEPHAPYLPPASTSGRFTAGYSGRVTGSMKPPSGFQHAARAPADVAHAIGLYDEEILYADQRLGAFLDALKGAGLLERSNIFVTADHGEEFLNDHGFWLHGETVYEDCLQVPLVAAGPAVAARGKVQTPVQMYDIFPTIIDLLNIPQPYHLTGTSLKPLLSGGDAAVAGIKPGAAHADPAHTPLSADRVLFMSHHRYRGLGFVQYVVNEGCRLKLLFDRPRSAEKQNDPRAHFELYDLQADPGERRNLLDERQADARRMIGRLIAYARMQFPFDNGAAAGDVQQFDAQQLRNLAALGYVDVGGEDDDAPPPDGAGAKPAPSSRPGTGSQPAARP
jgi:hypothetical protein